VARVFLRECLGSAILLPQNVLTISTQRGEEAFFTSRFVLPPTGWKNDGRISTGRGVRPRQHGRRPSHYLEGL